MAGCSKYLNYLTETERENMFEYYTHVRFNGGIAEVARKFKRNRKTIYRWRKVDKWDERYDKIRSKIHKQVDKAVETRENENLKVVRGVKSAILKKLAAQLKKGTYEVTVNELISLIRLEVELSGELPGESGDSIVNILNVIPALADKQQREKLHGNLVEIFGGENGNPRIKIPGNRFIASDN